MTTISAGTTSTTAYVATPDTTGALVLKTGSSNATALTLDASQNATFADALTVSGVLTASGGVVGAVTGNASTATKLTTASGSAPSYSARAWVNFNGTGTVAIRASGNVTSITDNGTGNYTVNFTTALPDVNYAANISAGDGSGTTRAIIGAPYASAPTVSAFQLALFSGGNAASDMAYVNAAFFR